MKECPHKFLPLGDYIKLSKEEQEKRKQDLLEYLIYLKQNKENVKRQTN